MGKHMTEEDWQELQNILDERKKKAPDNEGTFTCHTCGTEHDSIGEANWCCRDE